MSLRDFVQDTNRKMYDTTDKLQLKINVFASVSVNVEKQEVTRFSSVLKMLWWVCLWSQGLATISAGSITTNGTGEPLVACVTRQRAPSVLAHTQTHSLSSAQHRHSFYAAKFGDQIFLSVLCVCVCVRWPFMLYCSFLTGGWYFSWRRCLTCPAILSPSMQWTLVFTVWFLSGQLWLQVCRRRLCKFRDKPKLLTIRIDVRRKLPQNDALLLFCCVACNGSALTACLAGIKYSCTTAVNLKISRQLGVWYLHCTYPPVNRSLLWQRAWWPRSLLSEVSASLRTFMCLRAHWLEPASRMASCADLTTPEGRDAGVWGRLPNRLTLICSQVISSFNNFRNGSSGKIVEYFRIRSLMAFESNVERGSEKREKKISNRRMENGLTRSRISPKETFRTLNNHM